MLLVEVHTFPGKCYPVIRNMLLPSNQTNQKLIQKLLSMKTQMIAPEPHAAGGNSIGARDIVIDKHLNDPALCALSCSSCATDSQNRAHEGDVVCDLCHG